MNIGNRTAVIKGVVDIRAAVIEGREEETKLRSTKYMAGGGTAEIMLISHITQGRFCIFDRADTAEYVVKDSARAFLKNLVITALERHVVGIGCEKNYIAVIAEIQRLDNSAIECVTKPFVAKVGTAECLAQTMLVTVFNLCGTKFNVNKNFFRACRKAFSSKA